MKTEGLFFGIIIDSDDVSVVSNGHKLTTDEMKVVLRSLQMNQQAYGNLIHIATKAMQLWEVIEEKTYKVQEKWLEENVDESYNVDEEDD